MVAFGTSSPELAVSVKSALSDQANIALGNVIGSNIFNILFILGISALIVPLVVAQQLIRLDVPIMIALSLLVFLLSLDGNLNLGDGILLLTGLFVYIWFVLTSSRNQSRDQTSTTINTIEQKEKSKTALIKNTLFILLGLTLLVLGSSWLIESAVVFANYLGISELVIGLTVVAAGTSLPEVVTSIIAALRGEKDIAVGNVVGSNLFNIMGVLGIASVAAPLGIHVAPAILYFDIPIMIAVALACLPIFFTQGEISRKEGILLLGYYIAYTTYLVLAASHHDALPYFNQAMLLFVIPITCFTLALITYREYVKDRK